MRSGFTKTLRLGLSRTGMTLLQTSGWPRARIALLADLALSHDESSSPERLAILLNNMFIDNKCSNLSVTVILADDLARLFMVTPPSNAARLQDCQIAAEMRFQTLYGGPSTEWQLASDWNALHPFLTCAVPKALMSTLQHVARAHRMTLVEIVPQFIATWNRWHKSLHDGAWFGVANGRLLTVGAINQQRLCMVRTGSIPSASAHDKHWLQEYLSREALRANLPEPKHVQVCGQFAGHWKPSVAGSFRCSHLDAAQYRDGTNLSVGSALARSGLRI